MWRRSVRGVDFPPYILPTKGFDFLIPLLWYWIREIHRFIAFDQAWIDGRYYVHFFTTSRIQLMIVSQMLISDNRLFSENIAPSIISRRHLRIALFDETISMTLFIWSLRHLTRAQSKREKHLVYHLSGFKVVSLWDMCLKSSGHYRAFGSISPLNFLNLESESISSGKSGF
jgi:hypothetical protein